MLDKATEKKADGGRIGLKQWYLMKQNPPDALRAAF